MTTVDFIYKYNADGTYTKKNRQVDSGAISLTFVLATQKMTRGSGSFVTDGFTVGSILTTDATLNPGPFTITNVAALEITVASGIVNEGPVTKTATGTIIFTGDEDDQFCSCVSFDSTGDELFLLANQLEYIQKWDGGSGNFSNLGGWDTALVKARQIIPFQSRLIAGWTVENAIICARRVRWSVAGDIEDVTGTGSGFAELVETPDLIVCLKLLKNKLFVIKEKSIWELVYIGGTDVFRPAIRIEKVGGSAPLGIVSRGEELIIYGNDNVYLYDGLNLVPIGEQVYPYLYETGNRLVNTTRVNRVPSMYRREQRTFMMCCPTEGEVPSLIFEYYFKHGAWVLRDKEITAFGEATVAGGATWLDLVGTWEAQTWTWMIQALPAGAPKMLIGDSDGNVWEDDRLTKSTDYMVWETKDWMFAHAERVVEFRVQAKGGPFNCYYSLDQGETWSSAKEFAVSTGWTSYAEDCDIKWIEPWYIPRARSKSLVT